MSRIRSVVSALAVFIAAAPLAAQSGSTADQAPAAISATTTSIPDAPVTAPDRATSLAPLAQNMTVGVRSNASQQAPASPLVPDINSTGRNPALMIVGVAALLVGAVVGGNAGTIVMIGGGVVGLIGLWNYLQ